MCTLKWNETPRGVYVFLKGKKGGFGCEGCALCCYGGLSKQKRQIWTEIQLCLYPDRQPVYLTTHFLSSLGLNWQLQDGRRNSHKRTLSGTCSSAPTRIHICHSFPQPISICQAAQQVSHLNSQWQVTCWAQTLRLTQSEEKSTRYDINNDTKFVCSSLEL